MDQASGSGNQVPYRPGMPDRRQRKPDVWSRIFRYLTVLLYPVLIAFVVIFVAVASVDQREAMAKQIGSQTAAERVGSITLDAFMPIMIAGIVIGAIGLVLSRKRARRRSDYNYRTQLILIILSVIGLFVYFFVRKYIV